VKTFINKYWKILDAFILKKFLTTFFFSLCIIALISCVMDYSEKVDDFVKNKPSIMDLVVYYICFTPHITALLFPLFIFIATIFFTSKMAFKTEIIAILASGVSFTRFLRPYVVGGIILAIISLTVNHFIVPLANQQIHEFSVKYIWNNPYSTDRNIHIRLSPKEYVYVQNFDYQLNEITRFTLETIEDNTLVKKIHAERGVYDTVTHEWALKKVVVRTFNGKEESLETLETLTINIPLTPEEIVNDDRKKESLTTPKLLTEIQKQKDRGSEVVNGYLFERYKRTAEPFAGFVLCIIGACLASEKIRGGSGLHLALGIGGSAIYMLFMQFSKTFTLNAGVHPLISIWIPNIVFGTVAYYMYYKKVNYNKGFVSVTQQKWWRWIAAGRLIAWDKKTK
jgi:lipopolysaccharide export system permease protein